ncbi:helix-hairpin-helix domain-containing protein [Paenibacillus sp. HB172176]|uniref:helix-hairpin-helix domain-containing protein n=1 Tax=Paenibacillus sp. HB172176 TaxID=2493690 RepID=UPI00143C0AA5|nr:helix-hairpin-helix domain-containing protein [Paenibacillus sp. HB172176]
MKKAAPKLPLTLEERQLLRREGRTIHEIAGMSPQELSIMLQVPEERARQLRGLAEFQAVPSIGPKVAQRVADMGYHSLQDLAERSGPELIDEWERQCGYWEDPCLEDAYWCLAHHARHPGSERKWHDFTEERKAYRARHGYPAERPTKAWHEMER